MHLMKSNAVIIMFQKVRHGEHTGFKLVDKKKSESTTYTIAGLRVCKCVHLDIKRKVTATPWYSGILCLLTECKKRWPAVRDDFSWKLCRAACSLIFTRNPSLLLNRKIQYREIVHFSQITCNSDLKKKIRCRCIEYTKWYGGLSGWASRKENWRAKSWEETHFPWCILFVSFDFFFFFVKCILPPFFEREQVWAGGGKGEREHP